MLMPSAVSQCNSDTTEEYSALWLIVCIQKSWQFVSTIKTLSSAYVRISVRVNNECASCHCRYVIGVDADSEALETAQSNCDEMEVG